MPKELAGWPHPNSCSSTYQAQTPNEWCPSRAHIGANTYYLQQRHTDCGIWILPLQPALVRPYLKCWELSNDVDLAEASAKHLSYTERLWELGLLSLENIRLWGNFTAAFQWFKKAYKEDRDLLLGSVVTVQCGVVLNLKRADLDWIKGRNSLQSGWWDTGKGSSRKLWMFHHWKCSRQGGTEFRRTWSSGRYPLAGELGLNHL